MAKLFANNGDPDQTLHSADGPLKYFYRYPDNGLNIVPSQEANGNNLVMSSADGPLKYFSYLCGWREWGGGGWGIGGEWEKELWLRLPSDLPQYSNTDEFIVCFHFVDTYTVKYGYFHWVPITYFFNLTLVLLNPDIPCICKQYRSRSVDFWRSQLIWIYTVCH